MRKLFYLLLLLSCSVFFNSCDVNDDPSGPTIDPVEIFSGVFILNEGNYYSGINGSLSFFGYTETGFTIVNNFFETLNGRSLGGTPNDMICLQGRLYICVTDENRLEIVNSVTGQSVGYAAITKPREVCATTNGVYVSSYDGTVTMLDFDGHMLKQSAVVGAHLEGVVAVGDYIYVCNSHNPDYSYNTNVVKLNASTLEKVADITVVTNPTQLEYDGTNIYLLSTGNYADVPAQIQLIDPATDKVSYLCEATHMAVDNGIIYAINAPYGGTAEYFKFNVKTKDKAPLLSASDIDKIYSPCTIAVDPYTQILYVSSYVEGADGYADYSAPGYVLGFTYEGSYGGRYETGVGPSTICRNRMVIE